jgi:hypothetical protein
MEEEEEEEEETINTIGFNGMGALKDAFPLPFECKDLFVIYN